MHRKLLVRGPTFYSAGDEKSFFKWLQAISCVEGVTGHLRDLHIALKRPASIADLQELTALLQRYKMPTECLAGLKTTRNARYFSN